MYEGNFEIATATEADEYETESGIILRGDDLVNLIKTEITKIREKNQLADCSKICEALEKMHGLSQDMVQMSLDYMLKCGKIKDVPYAGRESLRIQSESNDELEVSKSRISADEEKVKKYRDEILEIASMHKEMKGIYRVMNKIVFLLFQMKPKLILVVFGIWRVRLGGVLMI